MVRRGAVLLACLSLLFSACTSLRWWSIADPPATPVPATGEPGPSPSTISITELANGSRNVSPSVPAADADALVRGNTDFALDLYRRLARGSGNLALGPYSISSAFALLNAGTAGPTRDQIDATMHFGLPTSRLDAAFNALSIELDSRQRPALTLATTNRIYGQEGYPFLDSYLGELSRNFGAPIAVADFRHDWETDRQLINAWAAGKTNGRISGLLPPGTTSADTRFVLVNAQYLHARWLHQFPESATRPLPFHLVGGATVTLPTMSQPMDVAIHLTSTYSAVDLPYAGNQLSMLVVMPSDLGAFERSLSSSVLARIAGSLALQDLRIELPSFSTRMTLSLRDTLTSMGVTDVFDDHADLSDMLDPGPLAAMRPPEHPFIDKALHEAFVRVSESGTEAAAATAITGGTLGSLPTRTLKIDHPFLWFIRDCVTGTILFMGRVAESEPGMRNA